MNDNLISHYKIISKISKGGMGVVYKAEDMLLDRIVALKFLPSNMTNSLSQKNRFINEAKALATLNHPNVATIHGIEQADSKTFIVMEFVEGHDLRRILLDQGSETGNYNMSLNIIIRLALQIVKGLQAAHQKQIIHRDIKPENIMISKEGQVKILDFGIAKIAGREQLTQTGTAVGTVAYMSPEQAYGKQVDQRTDIWSLGVLLYEMITGNRPFKGDYDQAIIYSILNDPTPTLDNYRQGIPDDLSKIVYKALAKTPGERYENCRELLTELQSCLDYTESEHKIRDQKLINKTNLQIISSDRRHKNIKWYLKSIKKRIRISWAIILSLILFFAISIYLFVPNTYSSKIHGKKIAVLPFMNMSNDVNDEYFSDGIMEDILTQLVKISDLKVISRTTMMHYKNSDKNLKQISKELNADVVLEGSIRHYANQLRIAVQLIDARTDEHIWAESYDRSIKDIFQVQSQIAFQIASSLQAQLSSGEKERLEKPATASGEAYNAFLQGRYFLQQRTNADLEKAIVYFNQALRSDPHYSLAWAGLSQVHSTQADMGIISLDEGYNLARSEAQKALDLDPKLADGYARLAWIKMTYDWDWHGAAKDYKQGLKLEPGNASIIEGAGVLSAVLGRLNEAIELSKQAIELNPLLTTPHYNLALHYYYHHQWEQAKKASHKALELNPQYPAAHVLIGRIYLAESKPKEAFTEMEKETDPTWRKFGLILAYHALGKSREENNELEQFIKEYQYDAAYQIAEIYAFRGDSDKTFRWLERAYRQRDGGLGDMKGDPLLDSIEKDPRYTEFMKKMNL